MAARKARGYRRPEWVNLHEGTKGDTAIFTTRFLVASYLNLAPPNFDVENGHVFGSREKRGTARSESL